MEVQPFQNTGDTIRERTDDLSVSPDFVSETSSSKDDNPLYSGGQSENTTHYDTTFTRILRYPLVHTR